MAQPCLKISVVAVLSELGQIVLLFRKENKWAAIFKKYLLQILKTIIMASIWKFFPESMDKKRCFGSASSCVQVIASSCVWHLHSSTPCCIRCWLWNIEWSYCSAVESPRGAGEALQSEGLFIISLESLKWAGRANGQDLLSWKPIKITAAERKWANL